MKASELRIGNYLFADVGLPSYQAHALYKGDMIDLLHGKLEGKIFPIPLTEEWLLRLGFLLVHEKNKHYCISDPNGYKDTHRINIFPTVNDKWHMAFSDTLGGYKDYIVTTKIQYVHQLQNLYFALTGEELTISK